MVCRAELFGQQDVDGSTENLLRSITEYLLGPLVEQLDAAALVDRDDRLAGDVEDTGEPRLADAQLFLRPLALGDVLIIPMANMNSPS